MIRASLFRCPSLGKRKELDEGRAAPSPDNSRFDAKDETQSRAIVGTSDPVAAESSGVRDGFLLTQISNPLHLSL